MILLQSKKTLTLEKVRKHSYESLQWVILEGNNKLPNLSFMY